MAPLESDYPKRSEWRLLSKTDQVFDFASIRQCIEVIFSKHKPIFITIMKNRKEIRLSFLGHLRKNFLEDLLMKHNAAQYIEIRGVMNKEKIVNDAEAYYYWENRWPHDTQPEGDEDVKLTDNEIEKIKEAIEGKFKKII